MGAGCSADRWAWSPSAECRRWWLESAFPSLLTTGACASDQNMLMLRATRRVATPGAPPDLPEGVEMLDVAMAEDVVAVRRAPFSGRYGQAS